MILVLTHTVPVVYTRSQEHRQGGHNLSKRAYHFAGKHIIAKIERYSGATTNQERGNDEGGGDRDHPPAENGGPSRGPNRGPRGGDGGPPGGQGPPPGGMVA